MLTLVKEESRERVRSTFFLEEFSLIADYLLANNAVVHYLEFLNGYNKRKYNKRYVSCDLNKWT